MTNSYLPSDFKNLAKVLKIKAITKDKVPAIVKATWLPHRSSEPKAITKVTIAIRDATFLHAFCTRHSRAIKSEGCWSFAPCEAWFGVSMVTCCLRRTALLPIITDRREKIESMLEAAT